VLRVEEVAGANPRLTADEFVRMKKALKESGLDLVESDAESRLAKFRARPTNPFLAAWRVPPGGTSQVDQ
jgi:hypothetical protein